MSAATGAASLVAKSARLVTTQRRIGNMINEKPRYFEPLKTRSVVIWCCIAALAGLAIWVFCAGVVR